MSDDLIPTPGGLRPKDKVHEIPSGHYIDGSSGNLIEHDPSGKVVKDHGPIVEHGNTNAIRDSTLVSRTPGAAVLQNGLVTFAEWSNDTLIPVNMFMATWTVPPPPATNSGQTLYLYLGLQGGGSAIEPALQWIPTGTGGSWNVATWYIAPNVVLRSLYTPVFPGQKLIGAIALNTQNGSLFSYESQFIGLPNSLLTHNNVPQLSSLYVAFATYNATKLSDYPNAVDTLFTNIVVQAGFRPPNPIWEAFNVVTSLGQHTLVLSNAYGDGFIAIFYV